MVLYQLFALYLKWVFCNEMFYVICHLLFRKDFNQQMQIRKFALTKLTITCSQWTIEKLEKGEKYVQT